MLRLEILLKCFRVFHALTFSWKSHVFALGDLACGGRDVNFTNRPETASDSWRPDLQHDSVSSGPSDCLTWSAVGQSERHGPRAPLAFLEATLPTEHLCLWPWALLSLPAAIRRQASIKPCGHTDSLRSAREGVWFQGFCQVLQNSKWYCFMWSMAQCCHFVSIAIFTC